MQKVFYYLLKKYCTLALSFYFHKWQIQQTKSLPKGPVLFVSNHQNAFLDAVLIACSSFRNPWFLTRANVFDKGWAKKVLSWLQMSPVYRFRDGFSTLRKNDEVIDNCVQLLTQQESILIFGEGNHNDKWYLRPLQKGFARIAVAAEERNGWTLDMNIVPVGIQYESHTKFRSRVLVTFGDPIPVTEVIDKQQSQQENLDRLLQKVAEGIRPLMLDIQPDQYEDRLNFWLSHRQIKNDLVEQLKVDQQVINEYPTSSFPANGKVLTTQQWWHPVRVYESINHMLPRLLVRQLIKSKIKDPQFIGSIKFSLGMILVPVFYILQTALCFSITQSGWISAAYFASLPLCTLLRR